MSIAKAMGLPTRGTVEATKLIIKGRLSETGREPRNVQVGVSAASGGKTTISLRDSHGVFLEADCSQQEVGGAEVDEQSLAMAQGPVTVEEGQSPTLLLMRM